MLSVFIHITCRPEGVSIWYLFESVAQMMQPLWHFFYCLQVRGSERKNPVANWAAFLKEDKSTGSKRFFQNLIYRPSACMPHPFLIQGYLKTVRPYFQMKERQILGWGEQNGLHRWPVANISEFTIPACHLFMNC